MLDRDVGGFTLVLLAHCMLGIPSV
jgi:hypothetical protein